jgi:dTDP-4-dehydrorhamnose reductase
MGKKVLITGARGMLGRELVPILTSEGYDVTGVDIDDVNLTNENLLRNYVLFKKPDVIIHTGALTDVDAAEDTPELSQMVNVDGTKYIARIAEKLGSYLIYISTDYVFDGTKKCPYIETDELNPINVYGKTKYLGEKEVEGYAKNWLIVRSAWLFGEKRSSFPVKIYRKAIANSFLRLVTDEIGSPTYARDLARSIINLMVKNVEGIFHFVNSGEASRYDLAIKTLEYANLTSVKVEKITAFEFKTRAKRPKYSVLDTSKYANIFGIPRRWEDALRAFFEDYDISKLQ